ncbi:transporter substrate-binding domain-containing protein [Vibrio makurazakiensis]|uniref:substrate-binding periplasmic protein n=1 Tax=Vibrio makurazakiensis TaxID=2910250 RepID=UPI003D10C0C7
MFTFKRVNAAVLCTLMSLSVSAFSQTQEAVIEFVIMEQVPYGFKSDANEETGVLFDIANKLKSETSETPLITLSTPQIIPTKRILTQLDQTYPVCTIVAGTPIIADNYDLIEPIGFRLEAGVLPAADISIESYSNLQDKSIAVPLGIMFDREFQQDESLNKISVREYSNGVKMLAAGRVDSVAGAIPSLLYAAKILDIPASVFGKPLVFVEFDLFLVCNEHVVQQQRDELKQVLVELKDQGTIPHILDRYFDLR